MAKVALVTDSTAYIPHALADHYPIRVAPLVLIWGEETYLDGVDIQPGEFYERLKTAKVMPSTSQVSPQAFYEIFRDLREQGYDVLAMLISEQLSGTVDSARQALGRLRGEPIEIVDTRTTAMGMGFQVLTVARAAEQGADMRECKALAEQCRLNVGTIFAVDTLEFLYRGGRISSGSRLLGTALNIKPILEVVDGKIEAVERVRTRKKSLSRLIELVGERIAGRTPVRLAVFHANALQEATDVLAEASRRLNASETVFSEVSPVIGTHAGPGAVGLAYMVGM